MVSNSIALWLYHVQVHVVDAFNAHKIRTFAVLSASKQFHERVLAQFRVFDYKCTCTVMHYRCGRVSSPEQWTVFEQVNTLCFHFRNVFFSPSLYFHRANAGDREWIVNEWYMTYTTTHALNPKANDKIVYDFLLYVCRARHPGSLMTWLHTQPYRSCFVGIKWLDVNVTDMMTQCVCECVTSGMNRARRWIQLNLHLKLKHCNE